MVITPLVPSTGTNELKLKGDRIMKQLIATIAVLFTFQAFAISLPGWNRPVESAKMEVQMANGMFAEVQRVEVVLTKLDGQMKPSQIKLNLNGIFKQYQIIEDTLNIEGARVITAVNPAHLTAEGPLPETTYITIVDYRSHLEQPELLWEVRVETVTANDAIIGELVLQGSPEPVFTIQIEQIL